MPVWSFLQRSALWISWPLCGLGAVLLWVCIVSAVRLGQQNHIVSLPLRAEQVFDFLEAGRVVLWLEGPQLTTRFAGVAFELTTEDGFPVEGQGVWLRQRSARASRVRIADQTFTVPHAGRYILRARGRELPAPDAGAHRLVFMRPHLSQTVGCVLGIVLGAVLVIGGVVLFCLRLPAGGGR